MSAWIYDRPCPKPKDAWEAEPWQPAIPTVQDLLRKFESLQWIAFDTDNWDEELNGKGGSRPKHVMYQAEHHPEVFASALASDEGL